MRVRKTGFRLRIVVRVAGLTCAATAARRNVSYCICSGALEHNPQRIATVSVSLPASIYPRNRGSVRGKLSSRSNAWISTSNSVSVNRTSDKASELHRARRILGQLLSDRYDLATKACHRISRRQTLPQHFSALRQRSADEPPARGKASLAHSACQRNRINLCFVTMLTGSGPRAESDRVAVVRNRASSLSGQTISRCCRHRVRHPGVADAACDKAGRPRRTDSPATLTSSGKALALKRTVS